MYLHLYHFITILKINRHKKTPLKAGLQNLIWH